MGVIAQAPMAVPRKLRRSIVRAALELSVVAHFIVLSPGNYFSADFSGATVENPCDKNQLVKNNRKPASKAGQDRLNGKCLYRKNMLGVSIV